MERTKTNEFAGITTETLDEVLNLICRSAELLNPCALDLNSLSVAHKDCALQLRLMSIAVHQEIISREKKK